MIKNKLYWEKEKNRGEKEGKKRERKKKKGKKRIKRKKKKERGKRLGEAIRNEKKTLGSIFLFCIL